jgi:hypothetical protein
MRGQYYTNLANEDVQAGRAAVTINVTNKPLHDYVPLYMGFKTPMVAVNQKHNEELLFLRFSLDILSSGGVVISNGNARAHETEFRLFKTIDDLKFLDIQSIRAVKYAHDGEVKRKKQSEVLIPDRLSVASIFEIICFSESAKSRVLAIQQKHGKKVGVKVNTGWYFGVKDKGV